MGLPRAARWATGVHLAGGLAVVGLAGYVYIAVVGRVFDGPGDAATVSALTAVYLLVNIIGPGCFTALEQETSRAVSAAAAGDMPVRAAVRRSASLAVLASLALVALVALAWPIVLGPVLGGRIGILVALVVAIVGSAAAYGVRGVLGGQQRFRPYALTFSIEGGVRLVLLGVLVAVGSRDPVAYAVAFAAAPLVAALVVGTRLRIPADSRPGAADRMGRSFALLIGATAASQTIANLAPVIVTFRLPADPITSSVFGSAFVLARIPLFLFTPVLAVLLPALTRHAEAGRRSAFTKTLGATVAGLGVLGLAGIGLAALAGPWAVQLLFHSPERPGTGTLVLLTTATVVTSLALVLQPALVALRRQRAVTTSWLAGGVVFVAILLSPLPAVPSALTAQLVGPALAAAVLALHLVAALRTGMSDRPAVDRPGVSGR